MGRRQGKSGLPSYSCRDRMRREEVSQQPDIREWTSLQVDLRRRRLTCGGASSYLTGNFAPIHQVQSLTPCPYDGCLPEELWGGQYVRNGGNPMTNEDLGRDAHWFDGDGMLSGVSFRRLDDIHGSVQPEFVNQYILTDLYLSTLTTPSLRTPILPSIAILVNPLSSVVTIILRVLRTVLLVLLSNLWGSQQVIKKISVANTAILYHDGRALATCESGPPMRVQLPGLETVGWFNGRTAEGEMDHHTQATGFGRGGLLNFVREWATAHVSLTIFSAQVSTDLLQPRVDPVTKELILFHSSFVPPYIHYSIVPATQRTGSKHSPYLFGAPVKGVSSPKMMHDFGVSSTHTVILDLPLSLDPLNLARNEAAVSYDPLSRTRFGVFPRWHPENPRWFETKACCIFHTANTWDEVSIVNHRPQTTAINLLACRLTSASLIYATGGIAAPVPKYSIPMEEEEEEQCRLYYYCFDLSSTHVNRITHEWALSSLSFEFASLRDDLSMLQARYIYGCSSADNFTASLGRAAKIDSLVKMDVLELIERGKRNPPQPITGCVDERTAPEILASIDPDDPIQVLPMLEGWYAQEPRFVPRKGGLREDDGWLLTYVFDESQLDLEGNALENAHSELWVIDARNMRDVVARIHLPQRVPYGLHGNWFSEQSIQTQRPVNSIRSPASTDSCDYYPSNRLARAALAAWMRVRCAVLRFLG